MNLIVIIALVVVAVVIVVAVVWARTAMAPKPAPAATLSARLARSRRAVGGRLAALLRRGRLDEEFWSELEDLLVAADVGLTVAEETVTRIRASDPDEPEEARRLLRNELVELFDGRSRSLSRRGAPSVFVVTGVNGSGKTTTIAKLAAMLRTEGAESLLGAADTFRAAADEQLRTWADRVGVDVVGGQPGADPAAVAFDAYQAARARGKDVVIVDTAGRLHSKSNLMEELAKVVRVLRSEAGDIDEVLLVLDGTTGQNALAQARTFTDAVGVTGIVLTKLDGTAKGGVVIAVEQETGIPVKYIGVGEGTEDLVPFEPGEFVDALLEEP